MVKLQEQSGDLSQLVLDVHLSHQKAGCCGAGAIAIARLQVHHFMESK